VKCPNCRGELSDNSNFCNHCGMALKPKPKSNSVKILKVLCLVLVCLGLVYLVRDFRQISSKKSFDSESKSPSSSSGKSSHHPSPRRDGSENRVQTDETILTVGSITIRDISGAILSQIPVPVVSGGWVALPTKICYGGYSWSFSTEPGNAMDVEWGILHDQDEVGLWWIDGMGGVTGLELEPWVANEPLNWVSMRSEKQRQISIEEYVEQGYFAKVALPQGLAETGIFMQADRIVGWSFGQPAAGGYLWMAWKGNELTYDLRVEDFYRMTFGGSREEVFSLALGRKDYSDIGLLAALAEGFLLESKLPAQSVPSYLRTETIIRKMRLILSQQISKGKHQEISGVFDSQILIQAQDPSLLADVAYAVMKSGGYENAVQLMDAFRESIFLEKGAEKSRLDELHSESYQGWIMELIEDGNIADAGLALDAADNIFPEDPLIHLLGVRLALENNDWEGAERLLLLRQYPMFLQGRVKNLENLISKLKSLEGKIVVRFAPGSKYIPVHGDLNGKIRQKFIIDTGATLSTIPTETARLLGLRINRNNPIRSFYTAGGVQKAPEVVLSSIGIGRWVIHDVKALVVDLPQQPELGLLGLNCLNNFRMNLNSEQGMLTLEPL